MDYSCLNNAQVLNEYVRAVIELENNPKDENLKNLVIELNFEVLKRMEKH